MAFPAVQTTASGNSGASTTSHTINLPASIASGDLLLAIVSMTQYVGSPTTTWPAGWTALVNDAEVSGVMKYAIRYRRADGTEGASISVTTDNSCASAHATYRIDGHHASTNPEASSAGTGSSDSPDAPSLNPSNWGTEDTLWISAIAWRSNAVAAVAISAYPSNYTGSQTTDSWAVTTGPGVSLSTRDANAASEDPGVATLDSTAIWGAHVLGVPPSSITAVDDHDLLLLLGAG